MSEKVINHEEYIEKLPKTVKIFDRTFEYDKNQVYYKNNVVTWFKYWRWRVLILIACLCCWVLPWIVPLCVLFANRKPWNKFVLKDDEWIWFLEKWSILMYPTKKAYFNKDEIEFINTNEKDNLIWVYKKKKRWWYKRAFVFADIYEFDKLVSALKKQWYTIKNDEKSKAWHWFRRNIVSIIVWSVIFLFIIGLFIIGALNSEFFNS